MPSYIQHNAASTGEGSSSGLPAVIPKSEDATTGNAPPEPETAKPTIYTHYGSAFDISYTPEDALKEGLAMVKTIRNNIKKLQLGSKLRQDVWLRELEKYVIVHYSFLSITDAIFTRF